LNPGWDNVNKVTGREVLIPFNRCQSSIELLQLKSATQPKLNRFGKAGNKKNLLSFTKI